MEKHYQLHVHFKHICDIKEELLVVELLLILHPNSYNLSHTSI